MAEEIKLFGAACAGTEGVKLFAEAERPVVFAGNLGRGSEGREELVGEVYHYETFLTTSMPGSDRPAVRESIRKGAFTADNDNDALAKGWRIGGEGLSGDVFVKVTRGDGSRLALSSTEQAAAKLGDMAGPQAPVALATIDLDDRKRADESSVHLLSREKGLAELASACDRAKSVLGEALTTPLPETIFTRVQNIRMELARISRDCGTEILRRPRDGDFSLPGTPALFAADTFGLPPVEKLHMEEINQAPVALALASTDKEIIDKMNRFRRKLTVATAAIDNARREVFGGRHPKVGDINDVCIKAMSLLEDAYALANDVNDDVLEHSGQFSSPASPALFAADAVGTQEKISRQEKEVETGEANEGGAEQETAGTSDPEEKCDKGCTKDLAAAEKLAAMATPQGTTDLSVSEDIASGRKKVWDAYIYHRRRNSSMTVTAVAADKNEAWRLVQARWPDYVVDVDEIHEHT